jgi:hypothetical protein
VLKAHPRRMQFLESFVIYMYTVCLQYFCRFSIEISDLESDNESDESETSASPCRYIAYCSLHTRIWFHIARWDKQHTTVYCNVLQDKQYTTVYCNVLHCTALHYNIDLFMSKTWRGHIPQIKLCAKSWATRMRCLVVIL